MKAEVRDDIISLDSFVQARFKYEEYLWLLRNSGNYCFLDQFKRHFGKDKGDYIITCMEKLSLVKTESLNNNYKYVYLTDTAMKYLVLKDDPRDFSNKKKNSISTQKVTKYPTEKQLFSSALKFETLVKGKNQIIIKDNLLSAWEDEFFRQHEIKIKSFDDDLQKIEDKIINKGNEFDLLKEQSTNILQALIEIEGKEMSQSSLELNKLNDEYKTELINLENEYKNLNMLNMGKKEKIKVKIKELEKSIEKVDYKLIFKTRFEKYHASLRENLIVKAKEYNEFKDIREKYIERQQKINELKKQFKVIKNKVSALYDISKIIIYVDNGTLNFTILDTGNVKTAYGYLKLINDITNLGVIFDDIIISIVSYSKKRADNLFDDFNETQKQKEESEKTMAKYEQTNKIHRKHRKTWKYSPSDFYIKAEKIYYNTPFIKEIRISESTHCLENYKKNLSTSENYIKVKDKKAIEDLKISLNNK